MKEFFICDCHLQENKVITSSFVVASKQVKPKKNGEPYLALTLADRTGQIEAKMWDNVEEFLDAFEQDDFLKVKGLINKYKNRFQLTIHKLRRMGEAEIDYTDYLPKTTKDIGELWQTLAGFVATFENSHLKALVELFMADPEIAERYRNAPAAKSLHHAYIGGCSTMWSHYSSSAIWSAATIPKSIAICCWPERFSTISGRSRN